MLSRSKNQNNSGSGSRVRQQGSHHHLRPSSQGPYISVDQFVSSVLKQDSIMTNNDIDSDFHGSSGAGQILGHDENDGQSGGNNKNSEQCTDSVNDDKMKVMVDDMFLPMNNNNQKKKVNIETGVLQYNSDSNIRSTNLASDMNNDTVEIKSTNEKSGNNANNQMNIIQDEEQEQPQHYRQGANQQPMITNINTQGYNQILSKNSSTLPSDSHEIDQESSIQSIHSKKIVNVVDVDGDEVDLSDVDEVKRKVRNLFKGEIAKNCSNVDLLQYDSEDLKDELDFGSGYNDSSSSFSNSDVIQGVRSSDGNIDPKKCTKSSKSSSFSSLSNTVTECVSHSYNLALQEQKAAANQNTEIQEDNPTQFFNRLMGMDNINTHKSDLTVQNSDLQGLNHQNISTSIADSESQVQTDHLPQVHDQPEVSQQHSHAQQNPIKINPDSDSNYRQNCHHAVSLSSQYDFDNEDFDANSNEFSHSHKQAVDDIINRFQAVKLVSDSEESSIISNKNDTNYSPNDIVDIQTSKTILDRESMDHKHNQKVSTNSFGRQVRSTMVGDKKPITIPTVEDYLSSVSQLEESNSNAITLSQESLSTKYSTIRGSINSITRPGSQRVRIQKSWQQSRPTHGKIHGNICFNKFHRYSSSKSQSQNQSGKITNAGTHGNVNGDLVALMFQNDMIFGNKNSSNPQIGTCNRKRVSFSNQIDQQRALKSPSVCSTVTTVTNTSNTVTPKTTQNQKINSKPVSSMIPSVSSFVNDIKYCLVGGRSGKASLLMNSKSQYNTTNKIQNKIQQQSTNKFQKETELNQITTKTQFQQNLKKNIKSESTSSELTTKTKSSDNLIPILKASASGRYGGGVKGTEPLTSSEPLENLGRKLMETWEKNVNRVRLRESNKTETQSENRTRSQILSQTAVIGSESGSFSESLGVKENLNSKSNTGPLTGPVNYELLRTTGSSIIIPTMIQS